MSTCTEILRSHIGPQYGAMDEIERPHRHKTNTALPYVKDYCPRVKKNNYLPLYNSKNFGKRGKEDVFGKLLKQSDESCWETFRQKTIPNFLGGSASRKSARSS